MKANFNQPTRRGFLRQVGCASGLLAWPSLKLAAAAAPLASEQQRVNIEKALPAKALVPPLKPRKLLIFDLNVNYGGHSSIPTANLAFTLMGEKTGAWSTIISRDPAVFKPESLQQFDAVFLNNNVGNLFTEPELRQALVEFVYGGGGLMGVHGTTVAFTKWPGAIEDWPEFGVMLGARGANHRDSDEHVFIKLDDPAHPLNAAFSGKPFEYRDEFFRVHGPYSRDRVRVLFSIDTAKTEAGGPPRGNVFRPDNDYALAWVRQYGRGRVFYCTIAHNPYVFWDARMLNFYLGAAQFVLGDLPAPTTPSAKLAPAHAAQERLGWRIGLCPESGLGSTLFETIDKAAALGCLYVGASYSQPVQGLAHNLYAFDARLTPEQLAGIRLKLDAAGVRLLTCRLPASPGSQSTWREIFQVARKMGIETFIGLPGAGEMDALEKLCNEFEINLALSVDDNNSFQSSPDAFMKLCAGRGKRIGICSNSSFRLRTRSSLLESVRLLRERLMIFQLQEGFPTSGAATEFGQGNVAGQLYDALAEMHRLGIKPAMIGPEFSQAEAPLPNLAKRVEFINQVSIRLAAEHLP